MPQNWIAAPDGVVVSEDAPKKRKPALLFERKMSRGMSVPLDANERTAVGQASGRAVRQLLESVVASSAYQQASPVEQQRLLERAVTEARATVRQQMQREALSRLLQHQGADAR